MLLKSINETTELLLQDHDILTEVKNSLVKEFEFFSGAQSPNEIILRAKTRQIEKIDMALEYLSNALKQITDLPLTSLLQDQPNEVLRLADKPRIGLAMIKELAEKNPGMIKKISNSENTAVISPRPDGDKKY